jgi:hypothetical protein
MFSWHTPILGARFIQREIVRSEMSNPSISSSPRIRASMRILPIGCLLGSGATFTGCRQSFLSQLPSRRYIQLKGRGFGPVQHN